MKVERRPLTENRLRHAPKPTTSEKPPATQTSPMPERPLSSNPLQQTREQQRQRAQAFAQTGRSPTLGSALATHQPLRQQLEARLGSSPVSGPVKSSSKGVDLAEGTVTGGLSLSTPLPSTDFSVGSHWSGNIQGGPFHNAEALITVGATDESGLVSVQVTLSSEQGIGGSGSAQYQGVGVGGSQQSGLRETMTYELKLSREQINAMLRGEMPFPNPAQPTTLPPSSSVLALRERFQQNSVEATISAAFVQIGMSLGFESVQGESFSVEALEEKPGVIRITAGPHDGVSHAVGMGVSGSLGQINIHAGFGSSWSIQQQRLQSIEIDTTTPEGAAAYQAFLTTGQLPPVDPPHVSNYQSIEKISKEQALELGLTMGPFEFTHTLWDTHSELTVQHSPEGTTYSFVHDARAPNGMQVSWIERPDGTVELVSMNISIGNSNGTAQPFAETSNPLLAAAYQQRWLGETLDLSINPEGIQELRNHLLNAYRDRVKEELLSLDPSGDLDYTKDPLRTLLDPNASPSDFVIQYEQLGLQPALDSLSFAVLSANTATDAAFAMIRFGALEQSAEMWRTVLSKILQQDPYALHSINLHLSNAS